MAICHYSDEQRWLVGKRWLFYAERRAITAIALYDAVETWFLKKHQELETLMVFMLY